MSESKRRLSPLALVLLLSGGLFILFLVISGALLMRTGGGSGGGGPFFGASGDRVGVIELKGVISDSKKTIRRLERYAERPDIKAVVLRLESPGGAVAPSQEIYQAVRDFKKPLVVSMGSVAASGAFYVACAAKKIYANPGTITGSIGVIMEFANLQKLYEWAKIQRFSIKTGKFKDIGAEYRPMRPEEKQLLQTMVDNVLGQFKHAVSTGRKIPLEKVTAIADGRIFSGEQARELKLVDQLGTLEDAINDAAKQAGIQGKPHVVYPEKPRNRWLDLILNNADREDDSESGRADTGSFAVSLIRRIAGEALGLRSLPEGGDPALTPGLYWIWGGAL